jgi:hypothetical protein
MKSLTVRNVSAPTDSPYLYRRLRVNGITSIYENTTPNINKRNIGKIALISLILDNDDDLIFLCSFFVCRTLLILPSIESFMSLLLLLASSILPSTSSPVSPFLFI